MFVRQIPKAANCMRDEVNRDRERERERERVFGSHAHAHSGNNPIHVWQGVMIAPMTSPIENLHERMLLYLASTRQYRRLSFP